MLDFQLMSRIHVFQRTVILNFIDSFLPNRSYESFDGINLRRRCRLIVGISGLSGLFCLVITALSRTLNGEFDASDPITVSAGIMVLLNPIIMRKTGNYTLVAWLFLIEIYTLLIILCLMLGGLFAPNALFLVLLPLITAFFLGKAPGLILLMTTLAAATCLYMFDSTLQGWSILNQSSSNTIYFVCFLFGILLCASISWLFEQTQRTTTTEMSKMLAQLRLAHADLVIARNEAEAASQAKSEFLATMSHEIRTPLNGVIGMTGLLLDTQLTSEQHEFADIVRNSGESLLHIINEILDFSKIEAGKIELEETSFRLRNCIEDALDLVAVKANEKNIELLHQLGESVPDAVIGDVTRLRQILLNLLSNAVKFTEQGEILVTADVEESESTDNRWPPLTVHFEVRDTGIGILPERMDRLFKSFSQVDASTTRQYGGTGLGLAISKRLCEMMGGTMWVESQLGQGSTFHFTIRLASSPDNSTSKPPEYHPRLENIHPRLENIKVLVIDDNATNRQILGRQLESWQMVPTVVDSGEAALELLSQGHLFHLVISDMQMPSMDGLMTIRAMRQRFSAAELPALLLTSIGYISRSEWLDCGIADTITKPIKASQLLNAIMSAIGNNEPWHIEHRNRACAEQPQIPSSDRPLGALYPLKILLAEDNLVNQKVALKMLQRNGYRADVAADGQEAIDALHRQSYDLIFMDVRMPNVDGIQATNTIRSEFANDRQPLIVAMTAEALLGDRERLLNLGMDDYISKPVQPDDLTQLLAEHAQQINNTHHGPEGQESAKPAQ